MFYLKSSLVAATALALTGCSSFMNSPDSPDKIAFEKADAEKWKTVVSDCGAAPAKWRDNWFLDGKIASVENRNKGMQMTSGPQFRNGAHHMVLWSKKVFSGDVRIDFEYTRLDFENRCVNIIYIQAAGSGKGPYKEDIIEWNKLRKVPAMNMYFNHMNTYHISFAAFKNTDKDDGDYIRARRYMPEKKGLRGTNLSPDYSDTGLFKPGELTKITIIKRGNDIYMRLIGKSKTMYCHWHNDKFPPIKSGRIGLRQMFTRSSRFNNITISQPVN